MSIFIRIFIMFCAMHSLPTVAFADGVLSGTELEKVLPKVVRVGFSNRILADADPRDAQAAMELWTKEMSRFMGVKTAPQTVIFRNTGDMLEALNKGQLSIVSLTAVEYLKLRNEIGLTPSVIGLSAMGKEREFLLIAHRDSGIRSVADLRGKTITLLSATKQEVSHIWLDVLLMREGKRDRSSFFRQVKEANSPSQAIIAVFFRKSDAAIISRGAFEISKVLNPQVGSQLVVVAESKSLMGDFTCIPKTVNEKFRESIEYAALHLHERPVGKQILTMFHIEKVVPFHSYYLDGIVELLREREKLATKLGKKKDAHD